MLSVEVDVPFAQIWLPQSVHSLVCCKVPIDMQERRGEGCDTVQMNWAACWSHPGDTLFSARGPATKAVFV